MAKLISCRRLRIRIQSQRCSGVTVVSSEWIYSDIAIDLESKSRKECIFPIRKKETVKERCDHASGKCGEDDQKRTTG